MTTVTHSYNTLGAVDADDKRAMLFVIGIENTKRQSEIDRLTALNNTVPPPNPLHVIPTLLPLGTGNERKSSYESIFVLRIAEVHASYIQQANTQAESDVAFKDLRPLWVDATPAKKAAALAALQ